MLFTGILSIQCKIRRDRPTDIWRSTGRSRSTCWPSLLYRLLTMQCKWTFRKRFTLSPPLICAGWTSILNLLSEMFSALRLSERLFFKNCLISIFRALSTNKLYLRIINGQNNMSGEKTRKLYTLAKLFQAMRSRIICWQDYRITY